MYKNILLAALITGAGSLTACDSFVNDVNGPVDLVPSDSLDNPANLDFVITGVQQRFATTHGTAVLLADGLSDAYLFADGTTGATFPTYIEIDDGEITLDNNSVDGLYTNVNELRFLADDLLARVTDRVEFRDGDEDLRDRAFFTAYFYGGVARYYLATYFGLEERLGGGTIDAGPFIPSAELYAQAIERMTSALDYVDAGSREAKIVNSSIARVHLYNGNLDAAATFAANGLAPGDAPFVAQYNAQSNNPVWIGAGRGRTQFAADARFGDDGDDLTPTEPYELDFIRQAVYLLDSDPIPFISAEETSLIRAEAALDDGDDDGALAFINEARGDRDDLDSVDLDVLIEQRDQILFTQGARLVDQRRFDRWHLGPNTWQYLPITQTERNSNPNL
ncbi:hypothetical protein [Rubricoccus marinus]|uniref:RagB/SusD domain-containing protein n=1 Tax=Rubricoccus marinus TaxID=716817 RepID=A0A259TWM7_9BACT|nr:hypothetical protein [Rubricoccus marinus]OZC02096.1 hypothetical protein BSZ36_03315 [Rubricoccus marinus]